MAKNIGLAALALLAVIAGAIYFRNQHTRPTPIEEGIPIYPGAVTATDLFAARLPAREREQLVKAVLYTTDDPALKVISFYKEKLSGKIQVLEMGRRGMSSAIFRTEAGGKQRYIIISPNEDTSKTEITISTVSPAR